MLFAAAIDVHSQEYKMGVLLGALTVGAICGLWPLLAGISKGRPVIGLVGFFILHF